MTVQMIALAALLVAVAAYLAFRQLRGRTAEPVTAGVSDGSLPGRRRSGHSLVYAAPDPEPRHFEPRERAHASAAALGLSPELGSEHDYDPPEAYAEHAGEEDEDAPAPELRAAQHAAGEPEDDEIYDEEPEGSGAVYASLADHAPVFRHSVGFVEDDEADYPEHAAEEEASEPAPAAFVPAPAAEEDDEGLPRIRVPHPGPEGSRFDAVNAAIGQTWDTHGEAGLVWVERAALRVHEVCGWIGHSGFDGYFSHVTDPNNWDEAIEGLRVMGQDEAAALIEQAGEAWWPYRETGDYPSGMFDQYDTAWNALALDGRALLEEWLESNYPWA